MAEEASTQLIDRAKGDRAAFGHLYDLYVHRIYGFALGHTRTREDAEDLTAQTFERALAAIGRYQPGGAPFSAWLFRIAANLAVDRARRTGRVTLLGDEDLPDTGASGHEADPPEMVERWERANWLLDQVTVLTPEQQQAVQLRFWGEQTFAEIGEAMGRSEVAAKQLVYRAVRGLRLQIEGEAQSNA
jgi:RNA polymerase sigma-70 factor (ECF subfamily)